MEQGQQRQSSEKRRQDFGELHSGIVGNEWTRRRKPQRGNRDPPALRFRGEKAGERSSQEASEQIERGLCEHDCKRSAAEQRVDRGQKSRIARHAQVCRGQLPADKQAVHVMIEPVARQFLVYRRVAGRRGEAPDKEEAQAEAGQACQQQMPAQLHLR